MDVQVVVRNMPEGPIFRAYAERKVRDTLDRFEDAVRSAVVRLEDVTGASKGGPDKSCRVELKLRRSAVHIAELGDDFYATIDVACDRLKQAVSREAARRLKRGIGQG
jgi:putative sigma-54 modulation protein